MPNKKEIMIAYTKFLISQNDFETAKKKLKGYGDKTEEIEVLNLYFNVMYNLAKEGCYKYNVEKAIEIANRAEAINTEKFIYKAEKEELEGILRNYE